MKSKISLEGLDKYYGEKEVLKGINFSVSEGEIVSIIGPSGSGKSTLIRCLNLLELPSKGILNFNGARIDFKTNRFGNLTRKSEKEISHYRAKVGMVFQHFNLFPNRTVLQNLIDGPIRVLKESFSESSKKAEEYLNMVGLYDFKDRYPNQLSGGQQQRVAIARAMMMDPEVLLFDEPTSALDPEMVNDVLKVMLKLKEKGMTMVVVTHEMAFTKYASDRLVFLENGEIWFNDSPQKLEEEPENSRIKLFINNLNHDIR